MLTYRFAIDNCSITELKFMASGKHKGWHVIRINDMGHIVPVGHSPSDYRI